MLSSSPQGLYPILDTQLAPPEVFPRAARALALEGCLWIQIRMKRADDRLRWDVHRRTLEALGGTRARLVVNDRPDLARALSGELGPGTLLALHLGQDDAPPTSGRAIVGEAVPIGLSCHTLAELARAAQEPADYLAYGPVFATTTKETADPAVGLEGLACAAEIAAKPLCAIGGISPEAASACLARGASAVAMAGALYRDLDLSAASGLDELAARARRLVEALG